MNARLIFTSVSIIVAALGTTLSPYYHYEQMLDRAVEATQSPSLRGIAMQFLRDIAEARPDKVTSDSAGRLGFRPRQFQLLGEAFAKDPGVRARGYRAIGRTGLAEALEYLHALTPEKVGNLGPRESHEAWPAAQIALQEARLNRIKIAQDQVTFLESAMSMNYDSYSTGKVQLWATEKLCDMGSVKSLALVEKKLRGLYSRVGDAETSFCRERMQVVLSHPDRAKALGSVLNVGTSGANQRLTTWAITQLAAMKTSQADGELDRFSADIQAIQRPGRNPVLSSYLEHIERVRGLRPR
jgi:hypothetical protein